MICERSAAGPTFERGAAGLTVVLGAVVVLVVGLAGVTAIADLALTSARARVAADAAALAAVGASPLAGAGAGAPADPQAQARQLAAANDAELVATDDFGWPLRYGVTVAVQPSTAWVRRLVGPVRAGAAAALRPRRSDPRGPPEERRYSGRELIIRRSLRVQEAALDGGPARYR